MKYDKALTAGRLKALRKRHGLSQSQVAAALRIDRSTYAYYELGRTPLPAESWFFWPFTTVFPPIFFWGCQSGKQALSAASHKNIHFTALLITAPLNAPFCQILGENGAKKPVSLFSSAWGNGLFYFCVAMRNSASRQIWA